MPLPCPRCDTPSPCVDWIEVDIGVGVQIGEETYECQAHGEWAIRPREFICTEHDDCKAVADLGKACAASVPAYVFRDDTTSLPSGGSQPTKTSDGE